MTALLSGYREEVWDAKATPEEAKELLSVTGVLAGTAGSALGVLAIGMILLIESVTPVKKWMEVVAFIPATAFVLVAAAYVWYWLSLILICRLSKRRGGTAAFRRVYTPAVTRTLTVLAIVLAPVASMLAFGTT